MSRLKVSCDYSQSWSTVLIQVSNHYLHRRTEGTGYVAGCISRGLYTVFRLNSVYPLFFYQFDA